MAQFKAGDEVWFKDYQCSGFGTVVLADDDGLFVVEPKTVSFTEEGDPDTTFYTNDEYEELSPFIRIRHFIDEDLELKTI